MDKYCNKCGKKLVVGKTISNSRYNNGSLECNECERKRIVNLQHKKHGIINDYKIAHGCYICGYNKCGEALDFHHVDNENKKLSISRMIDDNYSMDAIYKEMSKCRIVCANCHRELHANKRKKQVTING